MKLNRTILWMRQTGTGKRLWFDDDGIIMNDKLDISIMEEWEVIQENFFKFDYNMKLCIKEKICKIAYTKTIDIKPIVESIKTKGAIKKVKLTPNDNSTK